MVKVVCWNTNHQKEPWRWLHKMDADVVLVQEACDPPSDARDRVDIGPKEHWDAAVWNSEWWTDRPLGAPSAWPSGLVVAVDRVVFLVRSEH